MAEVDYPNGESARPDTQQVIADVWGHLPDDEVRAMWCANAAELFRVRLPEVVVP